MVPALPVTIRTQKNANAKTPLRNMRKSRRNPISEAAAISHSVPSRAAGSIDDAISLSGSKACFVADIHDRLDDLKCTKPLAGATSNKNIQTLPGLPEVYGQRGWADGGRERVRLHGAA